MPKRLDLTGQIFGKWTVISFSHIFKEHTPLARIMYKCRCDCGYEKCLTTNNLRCGRTKSCGCVGAEKTIERNKKGFNPKSGFNKVLNYYIQSAKKRNLEFNLSNDTFYSFLLKNCHYCNKEPSKISVNRSVLGAFKYNGIDRKDNRKGYSIDNCVTCCSDCNYRKHKMPYDKFIEKINAQPQ